MTLRPIDSLARFYESLTPHNLSCIKAFYAPNARFKDPFNEVEDVEHIQRIFEHMFQQLDAPRFVVTGRFEEERAGVLVWEMCWGADDEGKIEGTTHVLFDDNGKVVEHRDYWDPAESLYERVPVLGGLMRRIKRKLATP